MMMDNDKLAGSGESKTDSTESAAGVPLAIPQEILRRMKTGFDILQILGLYLLIEATVLDSRDDAPVSRKGRR